MGYALITAGGPDGRYTISLDYGEATRVQILQLLEAQLVIVDQKIVDQQVQVDAADASEAASAANLTAFANSLIAIEETPTAEEASGDPAYKLYNDLLERHRALVRSHDIIRTAMTSLKAAKSVTVSRITSYTALSVTETREAWCCDLTEDATGYVATVDIPGESNLILIAPGGRSPIPSADGVLAARELMSPEQAFFNVAILPGWQKELPTYRWGTLTAIDQTANTATVELFNAVSSAQSLSINQESTLTDVEFEYMDCHNRAFRVDDRVVVQFTGQSWATPKIIGFVDNPKVCKWNCVFIEVPGQVYCKAQFYTTRQSEWDLVASASKTVKVRFDYGAWLTLPASEAAPYHYYEKDSSSIGLEAYVYFYPLPDTDHPPLRDSPGDVGIHGSTNIYFQDRRLGAGDWAYLPQNAVGYITIFQAGEYQFLSTFGNDRQLVEFIVEVGGEVVFNAACTSWGMAVDVTTPVSDLGTQKVKGPAGYSVGGGNPSYEIMNDYALFADD
jgi:hypothetical protein